MTRRSQILIALAVLAVVLAALALLFLRTKPQAPAPVAQTNTTPTPTPSLPTSTTTTTTTTTTTQQQQTAPPAPPDAKIAPRRLATDFSERFGSFSSQGQFQNVVELEPFMTASLQTWAKNYVDTSRAAGQAAGAFYGVTSRALAVKFAAFDDAAGTADVSVTMQRQENKNGVQSTYYQELQLKLVKQNGTWLVDFVKWGAKTSV